MDAVTSPLSSAKRIVIKIGSALLVDADTGQPARAWLAALADDVAEARKGGAQVAIVSSGAIALGRRVLGLQKSARLDEKQAAAAAGQARLMRAYEEAFERHAIPVAQALLTPDDTERRRRWLNARATLETLLELGAVPIINENDTVATAEIRYGDNDRLSARVASMIESDCLVLLSDVDGLYTAPPDRDPTAQHLPVVPAITAEIEAMAGGAASHLSRGGMTTKVEAGKIATQAGTAMIIAKGTDLHPLQALREGARHTLFAAAQSRAQARKRWIMGTLEVAGALHVDDGAARALLSGKSLLPIGVTRVTGDFSRGDAISILDPAGREVARGLAGLDSDEARLVRGKKSDAVLLALGAGNRSEVVHRDDLVVLVGAEART